MANLNISACPFCSHVPEGLSFDFASTEHGPSVVCIKCGSGGPAALGMDVEQDISIHGNDSKLHRMAVKRWNERVSAKMMADAAVLIRKCREIVDDDLGNRAARHSLGRLHAELKHWLEFYRP